MPWKLVSRVSNVVHYPGWTCRASEAHHKLFHLHGVITVSSCCSRAWTCPIRPPPYPPPPPYSHPHPPSSQGLSQGSLPSTWGGWAGSPQRMHHMRPHSLARGYQHACASMSMRAIAFRDMRAGICQHFRWGTLGTHAHVVMRMDNRLASPTSLGHRLGRCCLP